MAATSDRGYVRFRLTEAQVRALRHLRRGSIERRSYLHRLGSDTQVIDAQRG